MPSSPDEAPTEGELRALLALLNEGLVEREQALRLSLLAALAGENVLLLGPPGTAKSLLARRVASAFTRARFFQYLLTRFTTPDELFGPVSLLALRERDSFQRQTRGYLPTAEVVFLDEIFKASSAILNSLLTLINERVFFNGAEAEPAPLVALLAASNELPEDEGLAALYDRFAMRLMVGPVQADEAFLRMIEVGAEAPEVPPELALSVEGLVALRRAARAVTLSPAVQAALLRVRAGLEAASQVHEDPHRVYVSDRRWRQALRALRVSAQAHGRAEVSALDCALLPHFLWNHPDDAPLCRRLVDEALEAWSKADEAWFDEAWRGLLRDIGGVEGVARPIQQGHRARSASGEHRLSGDELHALRRNAPELVLRTGLVFDVARRSAHPIKRGPRGGLLTTYRQEAHSVEQVAEALAAYAGRVGAMVIEDEEVVFEAWVEPGCLFELGAQPPRVTERWLSALGLLEERLAAQAEAGAEGLRRFDAEAEAHLFVGAEEVEVMRRDLARAALKVEEQREKARGLRGAIEAGGRFGTADLDHAELLASP